MAYKKRPNCPECGKMVRFNDSIASTEYGKNDEVTLLTKIWHAECYIKVKQPTPAEISAIRAGVGSTKAVR